MPANNPPGPTRTARARAAVVALWTAAALAALALVAVAPLSSAGASASGGGTPRARVASGVVVGIGDEHVAMFKSPLWQQLHTTITRYFVPYDAALHLNEINEARTFIGWALAAHQKVLVAFYHSIQTPFRMPSGAVYRKDISKFIAQEPQVTEWEAWNEANRGNIPGYFASPTALESAIYYRELRTVARHATIVGLDMLDNPHVGLTLDYLAQFKHDLSKLHVPMPTLWGLHNYSDTNRFQSTRTRAILRAVPGNLWLTETGGVVAYGSDFTNVHGAGLRRAARALEYMFHLTHISSRIKRLYIFSWSGGKPGARFDSGLMDAGGRPRQGYVVVCDHLLHNSRKCRVHVANN